MFVKKAYIPQGKQTKEFQKKVEETNKKIEGIKRKVSRMAELEAEYKILLVKVEEAERQLPKSEDLPYLIRDITKLGSKYGLNIDNWRIGSVASKQYHKDHKYSFVIKTSYHKAAQFFVDICQRERIMTVRDVKISPIGNSNEMTFSFTLVVYTYK